MAVGRAATISTRCRRGKSPADGIAEEGERNEDKQDARNARGMAPREQEGQSARRHREIIGVALFETERAGRIAAEMLEGERGEDRCRGDGKHHGARGHHEPWRPSSNGLGGSSIHLRTHIWR